MKKIIAIVLLCTLFAAALPALADGGSTAPRLVTLTHNCPNTGKMMPETFTPDQDCYVLTVANWVNRVSLTPTAEYGAYVTINGQYIQSGTASGYFQMTDEPQMVTIQVVRGNDAKTYTVFLQRRPSERRTRVSAGYISQIYQNSGKYYIAADLVSVNYRGSSYQDGNRSTFTNDSSYLYRYAASPNCVYYAKVNGVISEYKDIFSFMNVANQYPQLMYRIVYIEDEIVAVMPYENDY